MYYRSLVTGPVKQLNVSLVDLARRVVNGRGELDWKNDKRYAYGRCGTCGDLLPVCEVLRTSAIIFVTTSVMAAAIRGTFVVNVIYCLIYSDVTRIRA
jgi:hypothetical protein